MEIKEAWIKASVEHQILRIMYHSKTKNEITERDVEPDFYGWDVDRVNFGCWAAFDHLRNDDHPRCFTEDRIISWRVGNNIFDPSTGSRLRWQELIQEYRRLNLENTPWPSDRVPSGIM